MGATPETGYLVLADLTGYTAYLAGSEIEHAPVIAGDLLETIVGRLDPPFRLAKFEGDAALFFVEDGRADGSLLVDAVEAAYLAFRRRLRSIDSATECTCQSCRLAPRLDLKLFAHHGTYVQSRIAGRDELAGTDVILVHRLAKGAAAAASDGAGFALFTAAAVDALDLDTTAVGLVPGEETIDHLGRIATYRWDLEARWDAESGRRLLDGDAGAPIVDLAVTLDAPPPTAWAYLTEPGRRSAWEGAIVIEEGVPGGRRGVGTTSQCVTGRLATIEEIVDWQPFEHVGWRLTVPGLGPVAATVDLEPDGATTGVRIRWRSLGESPPDPADVARVRTDRERALERLRATVASTLDVVERREGPR